jgi:ParB/RepB/Spo0J family partition protein
MSQVDQIQNAEEEVAQRREEAERAEREAQAADLRKEPLAGTAAKPHTPITAPLSRITTMVNMRVGQLPEIHELAVSIKETGLLHPPLVRATGDERTPYELMAGRRRFAAMTLIDEVDGPRDDWRFDLVEGVSKREALTMQFAENFHQSKPEPVQFARAARAIMIEDPGLTAAELSRLVGAPAQWTRKALRLLELPESIVEKVEGGDLSFTAADMVRRGIAKGAVSEEQAEELVREHVEGQITGGALKLGVGYVPPPPENYAEISDQLDKARWAAQRAKDDAGVDREQSDWESRGNGSAGSSGATAPSGGPVDASSGRGFPDTPRPLPRHVAGEDLDAYLLGVLLTDVAPGGYAEGLGIADEPGAAHRYAFALPPRDRVTALRTLALRLLKDDPAPPEEMRDGRP